MKRKWSARKRERKIGKEKQKNGKEQRRARGRFKKMEVLSRNFDYDVLSLVRNSM